LPSIPSNGGSIFESDYMHLFNCRAWSLGELLLMSCRNLSLEIIEACVGSHDPEIDALLQQRISRRLHRTASYDGRTPQLCCHHRARRRGRLRTEHRSADGAGYQRHPCCFSSPVGGPSPTWQIAFRLSLNWPGRSVFRQGHEATRHHRCDYRQRPYSFHGVPSFDEKISFACELGAAAHLVSLTGRSSVHLRSIAIWNDVFWKPVSKYGGSVGPESSRQRGTVFLRVRGAFEHSGPLRYHRLDRPLARFSSAASSS